MQENEEVSVLVETQEENKSMCFEEFNDNV